MNEYGSYEQRNQYPARTQFDWSNGQVNQNWDLPAQQAYRNQEALPRSLPPLRDVIASVSAPPAYSHRDRSHSHSGTELQYDANRHLTLGCRHAILGLPESSHSNTDVEKYRQSVTRSEELSVAHSGQGPSCLEPEVTNLWPSRSPFDARSEASLERLNSVHRDSLLGRQLHMSSSYYAARNDFHPSAPEATSRYTMPNIPGHGCYPSFGSIGGAAYSSCDDNGAQGLELNTFNRDSNPHTTQLNHNSLQDNTNSSPSSSRSNSIQGLQLLPGLCPSPTGYQQTQYLGVRTIGEDTIHLYSGGLYLPTHINGQPVNAQWGLTKARTPRKRLANACDRCRGKKTRCDPKAKGCLQCLKAGRPCVTSFPGDPNFGLNPDSFAHL